MARTEGQWRKGIGLISPSEDVPILLLNSYLNFGGADIGASGYGVRDNSGTMQVKNSGGSWSNIAVGGGEANTASNLGTGDGVFKQKTGVNLEFKTLVGGTGVTLTPSATELLIEVPGASGEANTASSVGVGGISVYKQKTGVDLEFKSINAASPKITVVEDAANNEIDIDLGSVASTDLSDSVDLARQADLHSAVTVTDSAEIDLTLTGQDIKADIITGSVDVLKLDAGVQTSLGLADTAEQVANKDTANGYAGLDASGLLNPSQLPQLAIASFLGNFTDLTTALADAGVQASQRGDWFTVDTNGGETYIVTTDSPTLSSHVTIISTPTDNVSSVFGRTGAVTAQNNDYTTAQVTEATDKNYVTDAEKTVIGNTSGTNTGDEVVATGTEIDAGADNVKMVTPKAIFDSYLSVKNVQFPVFDFTSDTVVMDGAYYFVIPTELDGMNLISVHAKVITAGTTGTTDIQIHNVDNALDMLSTKLTIDSGETGSDTAATSAVINTANDHVNTYDVIRVDIDAVSDTPAKGLIINLGFRQP